MVSYVYTGSRAAVPRPISCKTHRAAAEGAVGATLSYSSSEAAQLPNNSTVTGRGWLQVMDGPTKDLHHSSRGSKDTVEGSRWLVGRSTSPEEREVSDDDVAPFPLRGGG